MNILEYCTDFSEVVKEGNVYVLHFKLLREDFKVGSTNMMSVEEMKKIIVWSFDKENQENDFKSINDFVCYLNKNNGKA
jgi:hypothetical protein